jgi:hypothetical protein
VANASCANCTLISNVLTLVGSVAGTVVVGMTVTGPSVAAGVTITSFGTGSGAAGTYNCSSSATNIPSSEAMVFSLSWDMPLVGNSGFPQLVDLGRAAGFGLIVAAAVTGPTAGPGQEYSFGAHAAQLYESSAHRSAIFPAVMTKEGPSVTTMVLTQPQYPEPRPTTVQSAVNKTSEVGIQPLKSLYAAPQAYDFTLQAALAAPLSFVDNAIIAEYQFGLHQKAIIDGQGGSAIWGSVAKPPGTTGVAPLKTIIVPPQVFDFTLQGFNRTIPLAEGWILTMVTAGPQSADLTVQANLAPARPFQSLAPAKPLNPAFVMGFPQADPTQVPARLIAPPTKKVSGQAQPFISAAPDRADYTQPQGQVLYTSLPGPSKALQPAFVWAFEQQYDKNFYPLAFSQPLVYIPPPPSTGFRVTAVTAGYYGGRFRTPGDVFDIASVYDFSDSSVNYQGDPLGCANASILLAMSGSQFSLMTSSYTSGNGWMARVAQSTPLFDWLQSNNAPWLPPQDPYRRFIY